MHSGGSGEGSVRASANAASCGVPRCPTIAVSASRYRGSAASAPRGGNASRKNSRAYGGRRGPQVILRVMTREEIVEEFTRQAETFAASSVARSPRTLDELV